MTTAAKIIIGLYILIAIVIVWRTHLKARRFRRQQREAAEREAIRRQMRKFFGGEEAA